MMRRLAVLLLACSLILPVAAAASEPGANKTIDITDTPIDAIDAPSVSSDGVDFVVHVVLGEEARENGTSVAWTVQMCLNSGVCNPPSKTDMNANDDGSWTGVVTPVDEHSYVNYDVVLSYPDSDESEKFPAQGFSKGGKVWSDCWESDGESGGDNCPAPEPDTSMLPAPGIIAGISVGLLAAMAARRED